MDAAWKAIRSTFYGGIERSATAKFSERGLPQGGGSAAPSKGDSRKGVKHDLKIRLVWSSDDRY
jgi:hypothetical protein